MAATTAEPEGSRLDAIVDGAAQLFYERGYSAVGMRSIAEAVGVRASSLYHYFDSKADLLYQISLGVTKDFIDELLPALEGPGPHADRLRAFVRSHIERRWARRTWISTAQQELRSLDPERGAEIAGYLRDYQRAVQAFIAGGAAADAFQVADPRLAGVALLDMINGVNGWYRPTGAMSIAQIAAAYADLAVGGLLGAEP